MQLNAARRTLLTIPTRAPLHKPPNPQLQPKSHPQNAARRTLLTIPTRAPLQKPLIAAKIHKETTILDLNAPSNKSENMQKQ